MAGLISWSLLYLIIHYFSYGHFKAPYNFLKLKLYLYHWLSSLQWMQMNYGIQPICSPIRWSIIPNVSHSRRLSSSLRLEWELLLCLSTTPSSSLDSCLYCIFIITVCFQTVSSWRPGFMFQCQQGRCWVVSGWLINTSIVHRHVED